MNDLNKITGRIVDAAFRIHSKLGPGLRESIYEAVLARDLTRHGFEVERQKSVSFDFEGLRFVNAFRVDLAVERSVIVEVKSIPRIPASRQNSFSPTSDCSISVSASCSTSALR